MSDDIVVEVNAEQDFTPAKKRGRPKAAASVENQAGEQVQAPALELQGQCDYRTEDGHTFQITIGSDTYTVRKI